MYANLFPDKNDPITRRQTWMDAKEKGGKLWASSLSAIQFQTQRFFFHFSIRFPSAFPKLHIPNFQWDDVAGFRRDKVRLFEKCLWRVASSIWTMWTRSRTARIFWTHRGHPCTHSAWICPWSTSWQPYTDCSSLPTGWVEAVVWPKNKRSKAGEPKLPRNNHRIHFELFFF